MIDLATTPLEVLAPGASVRVRGRFVGSDGALLRVECGRGTVRVEAPPTGVPEAGALLDIEGVWNGTFVRPTQSRILHVPRSPFPRPDGDYLWFHADGARRLGHLQARARILAAIRRYFDQEGFLEVETPIAVPGPALDLHLDSFELPGHRAPRFLSTSPEFQMKRLLAAGLERIYQIGRCFRRGEIGALHQPEFTMLEWYRTFAGSAEVMHDTERFVHAVVQEVGGTDSIAGTRGRIELAPPWERLTVAAAFERYAGCCMHELLPDEERFFRTLVESVEPELGRERPVFLVGWPASMASLARLDPDDPTVADRFEAYVDGIELSNGFGELTCPTEQRARFERDQARRRATGRLVPPLDEKFLGALEEGIPPSGGNALGVDRLVMLVVGTRAIADVVAFSDDRV